MRIILLSFLFLSSSMVFAIEDCRLALAQKNPVEFNNVEVFRRNNNFGQQQVGDLQFMQWFEVGPYAEGTINVIGLTEDGHIYHLVSWQDRKIARLLSGHRTFKEIYLRDGHVLTAQDDQGKMLFYSPSKWLTSPGKSVVKHGLITSAGTAVALATLSALFPDFMSTESGPTFVASAIGLQTFFLMLLRYERLNTFTDGFIPANEVSGRDLALTHWRAPDLETLSPAMPEAATEQIRKP